MSNKATFNAGMEDINARQFKKPSNARTLLKHAYINIITTGVWLRTSCSKGIVENITLPQMKVMVGLNKTLVIRLQVYIIMPGHYNKSIGASPN